MDFNNRRTFWKCLCKLLCVFLCVYLLLVYVVLEHKSGGRGPNSAAVVKDSHKDKKGISGYVIFIFNPYVRKPIRDIVFCVRMF